MNEALKNASYTLFSNTISIMIATMVTLVVPRYLGVTDYGYFQLYLFYTTYIGFFHLGWADGVFLRYGGEYYEKLDKHRFSGQFWLYTAFVVIVGLVICAVSSRLNVDTGKATVIAMTGIAVILKLPLTFLQFVLQGTNRIREYALLTIIERIVYLLMIGITLVACSASFLPIVIADLVGKLFSLVYAGYYCKDILLSKPAHLFDSVKEAKKNIDVGSKLLIANIASMLIIGAVRLSIEDQWDVQTFGKVSLTMSVSNLLMIFIRAVALVMFPMLRRTKTEKLSEIYNTIRTCLMIPLLGFLSLYYPMKNILSIWLPEYAESLKYMALLFPMCVFESKNSMLIDTYMKTLRKEKSLLLVNIVTVCLSVVMTGITVYVLHNLDLAVLSIVFLIAFKCVLAELLLRKDLQISVRKDIFLELTLSAVFVSSSWFIGNIKGLVLYVIVYLLYLVIKRADLLELFYMLKQRMRN